MSKKPPPRAVISEIYPALNYPIKRVAGDTLTITAQIFADGHDQIRAQLLHRKCGSKKWFASEMEKFDQDFWKAEFEVNEVGRYEFTVKAWVDVFKSWRAATIKKFDAGLNISLELTEGRQLIKQAASRAKGEQKKILSSSVEDDAVLSEHIAQIVSSFPDTSLEAIYKPVREVVVDRKLASFGAWYELFPRSFGGFKGVIEELPRIKKLGFDILYLPPIHPIGESLRKGKNNNVNSEPGDVGSPWAIGSSFGGHFSIHPELGTEAEFKELVKEARSHGIEIALDIAFQCAPDHPWVTEHPDWFKKRPDGSIQYAENPPKKYQDIYPLNFESAGWENLWHTLRDVFLHWAEQGVTIFRVDNPHTKAFAFWEWAIEDIKSQYPEAIFLSEAFSRPAIKQHLAKLGFTQSYTYFTWKNSKHELSEYLQDLFFTDVREYLRPNFFANTPDILHEYLQNGGVPAFKIRLILASLLSGNYGIYGPAFELCENRSIKEGSEEYLDSEKYQVRDWDFSTPDNISSLVIKVNQIRKNSSDFEDNFNLELLATDNDQIFAARKGQHIIVVNLDPFYKQSSWVQIPGFADNYKVEDLLTGDKYTWVPGNNFVILSPDNPAHVFKIDQ